MHAGTAAYQRLWIRYGSAIRGFGHVLATLLKPDRGLPNGFRIEFLAGVAGDTDLDSHMPVAAHASMQWTSWSH